MKDYIYIEPNRVSYYIRGNKIWKGYCSVCGKKGKTTSHHLIPRRMHRQCVNTAMMELRVRLCKKCEDRMHPENRIIQESELVERQQNNINNLRQAIMWRNDKIHKYQNNFKPFRLKILKVGDEIKKLVSTPESEFGYNGTMPGTATPRDYELYKKSMKLNTIESNIKSFEKTLIKFAADIEKLFNIPDEEFMTNKKEVKNEDCKISKRRNKKGRI